MHKIFWFSKQTVTSTCTTIIFGPEEQGMYSQGKLMLARVSIQRNIHQSNKCRANGTKKKNHHPNQRQQQNVLPYVYHWNSGYPLHSTESRSSQNSELSSNRWYILVPHGFSQPLEELILIEPFPAHIGFHGFHSSWEWGRGYAIVGLHEVL